MNCDRQDLKWRLYPMVRCVGKMHGPFHHDCIDFPCSLYLLCVQYDDALAMPTQNVLAYHMWWSHFLVSCCFLWAFLPLGLILGLLICYNLNWTKTHFYWGHRRWLGSLLLWWFCTLVWFRFYQLLEFHVCHVTVSCHVYAWKLEEWAEF